MGTYTAWTSSYVKSAAPIKNWFLASYLQMTMHGSSLLIWLLNNTFDNKGGFFHRLFVSFAKWAILMPIIDIVVTQYIYSTYVACSDLTAANFDSTSGTTQYVSCSGGTTIAYGTAGTIVK